MKIFIQIPCYNEELQIANILSEIRKSIDIKKYNYQIIIIDDGSVDKTVQVAKDHGVDKIISLKRNMGLGYAFEQGRVYAREQEVDILINTDADNQYKCEYLVKLIDHIDNSKSDIVVGVRNFDEIEHFSKIKIFLQKLGSRVVRIISGQKITDASSGFRAYSKDAIKKLQVSSNYSYTLESLIQAKEKNLLISEIPIKVNPPTRDSRLFKTMREFITKQMLIILNAFLIYKPLHFFSTLSLLPISVGMISIIRFFYYFAIGDGAGKIQSLILGSSVLLLGVLLFFMGLLGYLIKDMKKSLDKKNYLND